MSEQRVLVCSPLRKGVVPDTAGRRGVCGKCGRPIWISHSSPRRDVTWCTRCAVAQVETGEPFKVGTITEAQIEDVERWRVTQRRPQ